MEQHVFQIVTDNRGRHRKGSAIYNATEVNSQQKTFVLMNKNDF
jgi:hypothetical protein